MGRNSGNIALYSGIAGGAEAIVIPEIPADYVAIVKKILAGKERRKRHSILVFEVGCGDVGALARHIESACSVSVRTTRLGYIQRGGSPSAFDRVLASRMGAHAVEAYLAGKRARAVCITGNKYVDADIGEALDMKYSIDRKAYETAMEISI
jgi:6-phosphofructokinase 1